jgi:hypothetical protein
MSDTRSNFTMSRENKQRSTPTAIRITVVIALLGCSVQCCIPDVYAAPPKVIDLGPITVAPDQLPQGQHPNIESRVSQAPTAADEHVVVNIIAVMTQPDKRVKSWNWEKVKISRGAARSITVPKEYDTSVAGTYRVEIIIYSVDMKHRYASRSGSFIVVERQQVQMQGMKEPDKAKAGAAIASAGAERERVYAALGIYGNALNPAGGGTLFLWPSRYIGVQGLYSLGAFTSYEGRLLAKADLSSKYSVYGGIGYIHVTTEKDIIGVTTQFDDGGMSGVVGVEVSLGKKVFLYIESSAAGIDLEKTVKNGPQTVNATVKYAPVTIGISLVMAMF